MVVTVVVVDEGSGLPRFQQEANRNAANVLREELHLPANVWSDGSYSFERLDTPQEVIEAIAETYMTPVRDGIVTRPEHWKGLQSLSVGFGGTLHAERPKKYFAKKTGMPGAVSVTFTLPRMLSPLSEDQVNEQIRVVMERRGEEIRLEMAKKGERPLGMTRALKANPRRTQPVRRWRKREKDEEKEWVGQEKWGHRVAPEFLVRWKAFLERYRAALAAWRSGNREVVFPYGTYWMRVFHKAPCEGG